MTTDTRNRRDDIGASKGLALVFAPITWPVSRLLSILSFILMSIVMGTVLDWIGMWAGWWGANHQLHVLSSDIAYLGTHFTTSILGKPPADVALMIGQYVHRYLSFDVVHKANDPAFFRALKQVGEVIQPYWQSIVYSAMTVVVRIFIIALSLVFYVVVFLVAMIDGLVERELRKEGGGIERAQIYHHAKIWIPRILYFSPMIYLAWPWSINPGWIVVPSAVLFGLSVYLTFATFMKHL